MLTFQNPEITNSVGHRVRSYLQNEPLSGHKTAHSIFDAEKLKMGENEEKSVLHYCHERLIIIKVGRCIKVG